MSDTDIVITVTGGHHDVTAAPVSVRLSSELGTDPTLVERQSGRSVPSQRDVNGAVLTWIERDLPAGESRTYGIDTSPTQAGIGVALAGSKDGVDVLFGGELFTSYRLGGDGARRPYLHPVTGPGGGQVTRNFPMVEGVSGETTDHTHHRGIWLAHGEVNSIDNWTELDEAGYTLHRGFRTLSRGPVYGRIVADADWVTPDKSTVVLHETRDVTFYDLGGSRIIDVHLTLTAADEDVLFGDTKEAATIALRVASTMDQVRGGRIENGEGDLGEAEAYGRRSTWCDYSGPVGQQTLGVALFDHNTNFRHPTNWHARDYGVLTANPFGLSGYEGPGHNGRYTLPAGDSLEFRHRVYLHTGDATEARIADRYQDYVDPPSAVVEAR